MSRWQRHGQEAAQLGCCRSRDLYVRGAFSAWRLLVHVMQMEGKRNAACGWRVCAFPTSSKECGEPISVSLHEDPKEVAVQLCKRAGMQNIQMIASLFGDAV